MRDSLRVRLILWYAGVLALVIVSFGGAVSYQAWRSTMAALDQELRVHALQVAAAVRPAGDGRFDVDLPPEALDYFRQDRERYYVIWAPNGELVDRSDPAVGTSPASPPGVRSVSGRRELSVPAASGAVVLVGRDLSAQTASAWSLGASVALAGAGALALAILGGWFVAGRALAPIERISRVAQAMVAGDLAARIPVERTESELEQVASALNDAFDRLRLAIEQQRRFTADASHELRTPVSVMRAELDWALGRDRGHDEYRQSLVVCRRAVVRIEETIDALLRTARADANDRPALDESVQMQPLAADIVGSLEPLAHERGVTVELTGGDFPVAGDRSLLREAVSNIVANAIQYNRPGGRVVIAIRRGESAGCVEVADTGVGVPAWAVPRLFDRFFRVDDARARDAGGGVGLGLSVAHAIVTAHRGSLSCTSREGAGSVFLISLPLNDVGQPSSARGAAQD